MHKAHALYVGMIMVIQSAAFASTYHFSSSGDDSRTESAIQNPATPWKSLSRISLLQLGAGDSVLLARGDTLEGSILITRSGVSGDPIVIGAYGTGPRPVVSGCRAVTGWSAGQNSIYTATVDTPVTQVFCDGAPLVLARYPNVGYRVIDSAVDDSRFIDAGYGGPSGLDGAVAHIRTIRWTIESIPLASYNSSSHLFTLSHATGYTLYKEWGYLLNNALSLLDTAGEWYHDSAVGVLHVRLPDNSSPQSHSVRASVFAYGVRLNGSSHVAIENLVLFGHAVDGISGSGTGITVTGVGVTYPDGKGIGLSGNGMVLERDTVIGANQFGIQFHGDNCEVRQSAICRTGMFRRMNRSGIGGMCCKGRALDFGGRGNHILENRIDSTGYIAIGFGGADALIERNWITNTCLTVDDGSGIYTWSDNFDSAGSAGSVVRDNIVANSIGNGQGTPDGSTFANGIYMDDRIHNVEIYGNTCVNTDMGLFLHNNRYVNAHDNICYNNRSYQIAVQRDAIVDQDIYGNVVRNNVMYRLTPAQGCYALRLYAANGQTPAAVDSNVCCGEREARCDRDGENLWRWTSSLAIGDSAGGQMIANGSFDAGIQNWGSWPAENVRTFIADGGLEGGALRAEYTGATTSTPLITSSAFSVAKDSTYELYFWARGAAPGNLGIVARENHANWATVGCNSAVEVTDRWQEYSVIFNGTADEPDARVDFTNQRPDSVVYLDRISLFQVHVRQEAFRGILFVNETAAPRTIVLNDGSYRTVDGAVAPGPLQLEPYGSVVLVRESSGSGPIAGPGAGENGPGSGVMRVRVAAGSVRVCVRYAGSVSIVVADARGRIVASVVYADGRAGASVEVPAAAGPGVYVARAAMGNRLRALTFVRR